MKAFLNFVLVFVMILQTGFLSMMPVAAQGEVTETPTPTQEPTGTPEVTSTPVPGETPTPTSEPSPTPTAITETPSIMVTDEITLSLATDPPYLKRGGELYLEWSIGGMKEIRAGSILRVTLSKGLTLSDPSVGKLNETGDVLELEVIELIGKIEFMVGEEVESPLVITVELLQEGTSLAKAEVSLLEPSETIVESKGGTADGLGGKVKVTFPEGALPETVKVSIEKPSKKSLPVQSLSGSPFEITAVSEPSQAEVSKFTQPVEIQVAYSEAGLTDEADLRLYWYDPTDGQWKLPLSQHVDTENNLIIAYTDHFTVFDTYNSNWQTAVTPTLESFQHAGFTGAASFSMPIKVPAGPGGFQPSLTLSYSSSVVDNVGMQSQASWVGMGWSLTTSYIERNGHGTNGVQDDSYSLNLNGMSVELLPGADGEYHASDENFYKSELSGIEPDTTWTIWDKTGNKYTFAHRTNYLHDQECTNGYEVTPYVWRWSLSKVENVYGQVMNYTYQQNTKTIHYYDCKGNQDAMTAKTWVYPSMITYANNRYRIVFNRIDRTDYETLWASEYSFYTAYQQSLLKSIQVEQDETGDGDFETIIHKYIFYYAAVGSTIFPDYQWSGGGYTPTLTMVREYGLGAANALPAYSFNYEDDMHLTSATNGYGGTVTFTYDNWHETIPYAGWGNNVPDNGVPALGNPQKYHFSNSADGWMKSGTTSTLTYDEGGNGSIIVVGTAQAAGVKSFQPGRWYMIVASVRAVDSYGTHEAQLGFNYTQNGTAHAFYGNATAVNTTQFKTIASGPLFLPVDATSLKPRIVSTGSNRVNWYYLYPLPTAYRVTERMLSTSSDSYSFTYAYTGAATNNPSLSDAAAGTHPYINPYTEFRGHSQVIETDPYGKKTITEYNQSDCLGGRPSRTTLKQGTRIMEVSSLTYACSAWNTSLTLYDVEMHKNFYPLYTWDDVKYDKLKYRWVRTVSESRDVYGGSPNGVAASLLTEYGYDPAYGNLTQKTVSGTDIATTTTTTDYFPNASATVWLVGLPARTTVTNAGGTVLSRTLNLYDNHNNYTNLPTVGILTGTRTLMRGTQYSQVSYVRDAWGNAIEQMTWTGYGTASADPTDGAQSTYTCYGTGQSIGGKWCANDGYHTYPLWTKNAKGHISTIKYDYNQDSINDYILGVPTSETDPNGAVTTVTYDVFGRFKSLTRPGDSTPSLNVTYVNNPFKVTLTQEIDTGLTYTVVRNYDGMGRQTSSVTGGVTTLYQYGNENGPLTPRVDKVSMPGSSSDFTATKYDALGRPLNVSAPDGTSTTYAYNGLMTTVTDAKNHSTTSVSNILGWTLSVTPPTGPGVDYTYDDLGNLLSATRGGAAVTLAYDKAGRKTSMDDPDMGGWSYTYDALGNMLTQTDARGCVLTMMYDELNRLDTKTSSGSCGGHPSSQISVDYDYDSTTDGNKGIGRRTSMGVSGGDFTSWFYDIRGRVEREAKQILPNGGQYVTRFTYNSADLPKTMTYPDNEVVTFNYNYRMLVEKVFNDNGTPGNLADDINYAQSIAYDSASRMVEIIRGENKIHTDYTYNAWNADGGRLLSITSTQVSNSTLLQGLTYDYDSVGNINTIVDNVRKNEFDDPQKQCFQYDELDRLLQSTASYQDASQGCTVQAGVGNYNEGYAYDGTTGNLASKGTVNYTAYDANHKHAVTTLSNGNTYGYDENGNMTSRNVGGQINTLMYDAENRLISVSGAATASFSYDADGKQVIGTVNGVTTYYVGNHYEKKNDVVTKYYFAGATRLAVRTGETLSYLLADHIGSSSVTTDANGGYSAQELYKAFGESRHTDGTLGTDYKFTGQRSEAALGIYFFQSRWFDPSLGRFTQPDTIVPTQTQGTQAWDRYAFVNNNPVRYIDPTGHSVDCGLGDSYCTVGYYSPGALIAIYHSNYDDFDFVNGSGVAEQENQEIDDFLNTHPDYHPNDDPYLESTLAFKEHRIAYWQKRLADSGVCTSFFFCYDEAVKLFMYYDEHQFVRGPEVWDSSKVSWPSVTLDIVGIPLSLVGVGRLNPSTPLGSNLLRWAGFADSTASLATIDNPMEGIMALGSYVPIAGAFFDVYILISDLSDGRYYLPYNPPIPR